MNSNSGKYLIILEDEPAHAEAIKRYLSLAEDNYNIIISDSLKEFNNIIANIIPDLVIADINLPDGNAFTLLKGDIEKQSWPILVMTSFGDEETAVKAIKSGAQDYIVKSPEAFKNIAHVVRRNLRDWKNMQERRESEKQFRILFETMAQGVIYQDENNKILAANSAAEKITGLTSDQMRSRNFFDPRHWVSVQEDGSNLSKENHPAMLALQTGLPVKDKVIGLLHPQKEKYIWLLVSAIPQFRENETKPYQVFTTFTDITEIKLAELELKKAKERAEESDRLKSTFMANMSHEIRTPMNGILGFADLLKTPNLSGESQKRYIEAINTSGKRMLDIINDLIDISKIESGQLEIRKENTDIPELLNELILFFTPESRKKRIDLKLNIQLPSNKFIVETDKTKLAQVITNLLKNALKFTVEKGRIELGCSIQDNINLVFYVKDTGRGIRKEISDKIFERFRQGDSPDEHEGVGLGLAISKAYVELLGGRIELESEPGKGSVFSFTLPFNPSAPSTGMSSAALEDNLSHVKVLVVEDDDLNYSLLSELLKRINISTCYARNGLEAVNMIKDQPDISLVLMDIKLPIMNGNEATMQIKKIRPGIPVIAHSAYAGKAEIQQSFQAGCDDYITKPVDTKLFLEKISWYCSMASR